MPQEEEPRKRTDVFTDERVINVQFMPVQKASLREQSEVLLASTGDLYSLVCMVFPSKNVVIAAPTEIRADGLIKKIGFSRPIPEDEVAPYVERLCNEWDKKTEDSRSTLRVVTDYCQDIKNPRYIEHADKDELPIELLPDQITNPEDSTSGTWIDMATLCNRHSIAVRSRN